MSTDFSHYWSLTNYQRHCLLNSNIWRVQAGHKAILIPPGEEEKIISGFYSNSSAKTVQPNLFDQFKSFSGPEPKIPQPRFSFFNPPVTNTLPAKTISLAECASLIKLPHPNKQSTDNLRALATVEDRKRFKAQSLSYVCFSGIFSRRSVNALKNHSGLIVIDLDHLPNPEELKQILKVDYTLNPAMIFISPSGDGLKIVIPVNILKGSHADYFDAIKNYLSQQYGLDADPSGRDISRACFLCHDPKIFLNPEYNDWR